MKRTLLLVCLIIPLVAFPSGCGRPILVDVECDAFKQQKNVTREIDIWPAYILTVYLCSNPNTGFSWSKSADISDQSVIRQTWHESAASKEPLPGSPGKEMWTFQATQKGTSTIRMVYSRPGEAVEKPEWTFTLTVNVRY
jgi:predicted secreted protein